MFICIVPNHHYDMTEWTSKLGKRFSAGQIYTATHPRQSNPVYQALFRKWFPNDTGIASTEWPIILEPWKIKRRSKYYVIAYL